jgi:hypothetical protein
MNTTTEPPDPPDHPPTDAADEVDVDLEDEDTDPGATIPEGVSYLGTYPTIEAYLRDMIEPEVSRACAWILDTMDWSMVQARFEADGSRLFCECGQVFKVSLKANPKPTPGEDAPGPWSPTRGC